MTTHLMRRIDSGRGRVAGRPSPAFDSRAERPSIAKQSAYGAHRGPRGRPPDVPVPRVARSRHFAERLFDLAIPMGLSLLITAGFAAALGLYTNLTLFSPHVIDACVGFFLWSWGFLACVTNSRE
jgi:hypothetical protein